MADPASQPCETSQSVAAGKQNTVRRAAFSLKTLFVIVSIAAVIALVASWVKHRREEMIVAGGRLRCTYNIGWVEMGLRGYFAEHGTLPPAFVADANGRPMHSWRVLILPFMGEEALYAKYRFDEPWDGPNNRLLANQLEQPFIFCFPNCSPKQNRDCTNYVAVVGKDTAFPGATPTDPTKLKDDMRSIIFLVEIGESDIHWMEPRDVSVDELIDARTGTTSSRLAGHDRIGPQISFPYHSFRLKKPLPAALFKSMVTVSGGEKIDRTQLAKDGYFWEAFADEYGTYID
jgi:hypothetical protein